jgi:hypothetical protein
METMEKIGVPGHLTFSSGWEWGYWLIDWSIARWSWRYSENGKVAENSPLDRLNDLFPGDRIKNLWKEALDLQNLFLKQGKLLHYMSALPPFAELFPPFNRPFQPVPDVSPVKLIRSGDDGIEALNQVIRDLGEYANAMERIIAALDEEIAGQPGHNDMPDQPLLYGELKRGLQITILRAGHRGATLRALIAAISTGSHKNETACELLKQAALIRQDALKLVRQQENLYRYPVEHLARRRKSLTAYGFGYLYPVNSLFFWEREEEQVRKLRFDAFFMNIWDFGKIMGLGSLFPGRSGRSS